MIVNNIRAKILVHIQKKKKKPRNVHLTFLPNAHCNCQTYFYNDKKTNTPTVTNKATNPCEHTLMDSLAFHCYIQKLTT